MRRAPRCRSRARRRRRFRQAPTARRSAAPCRRGCWRRTARTWSPRVLEELTRWLATRSACATRTSGITCRSAGCGTVRSLGGRAGGDVTRRAGRRGDAPGRAV